MVNKDKQPKKPHKIIKITLIVLGSLMGMTVTFLIVMATIHANLNCDTVARLRAKPYMKSVEVDGLNVYYRIFNEERSDKTIVFMSGSGSTNTTLALEPLAERINARVIVIDRPGYGLSEDSWEKASIEYIVDYYREALKKMGINEPVILMPHSISGIYAKYWTITYPDEVSAIIYIDTPSERYIMEYEGEYSFGAGITNWISRFGVMTGVNRLVLGAYDPESTLVPNYGFYDDDEFREMWDLTLINTFSQFNLSELENYYENARKVLAVDDNEAYQTKQKIYIEPKYLSGDFYEKYYKEALSKMYGNEVGSIIAKMSSVQQEVYADWEDDGNIRFAEINGPHCVYYFVTEELADIINSI